MGYVQNNIAESSCRSIQQNNLCRYRMARETIDDKIKKVDQEIETVSSQINELATRQQRLVGYRQCLVDMKEENATSKNTGSG